MTGRTSGEVKYGLPSYCENVLATHLTTKVADGRYIEEEMNGCADMHQAVKECHDWEHTMTARSSPNEVHLAIESQHAIVGVKCC